MELTARDSLKKRHHYPPTSMARISEEIPFLPLPFRLPAAAQDVWEVRTGGRIFHITLQNSNLEVWMQSLLSLLSLTEWEIAPTNIISFITTAATYCLHCWQHSTLKIRQSPRSLTDMLLFASVWKANKDQPACKMSDRNFKLSLGLKSSSVKNVS